ncbi:MAG: hypothetical protein NZ989_04330 [Bacteroidia bacterium]|nr:hypothetical protein [Bacteroidia bacterium]MDW8057212.1 hypothetical protein [Bacteroidia bacterium]
MKDEYFQEEATFLEEARARAERGGLSAQEWREAYATLVDNYENLLKVVQVLTHQATQLESKLEKARAQLELQRKALSHEVEDLEKQVQYQQKEVHKKAQERDILYDRMGRTRLMLIVLFAVLLVIVAFAAYYIFIDTDQMIDFVKRLRGIKDGT